MISPPHKIQFPAFQAGIPNRYQIQYSEFGQIFRQIYLKLFYQIYSYFSTDYRITFNSYISRLRFPPPQPLIPQSAGTPFDKQGNRYCFCRRSQSGKGWFCKPCKGRLRVHRLAEMGYCGSPAPCPADIPPA